MSSDFWQQLELPPKRNSNRDTLDWVRKWFVNFSIGKTQFVLFGCLSNSGQISSKMEWVSDIVSFPKTNFKKARTLISSMKFFSSAVVLYLFKCTMRPYMGYCCHVWANAPAFYLDMLDNLR